MFKMESKLMKLAEEFSRAFSGLNRAYGQWGTPPKTVKKKLTMDRWESHLQGRTGLGVVPINEDSKCVWAALDIDIDDIDHIDLLKRVTMMKLPLIVCRSKSGAAHCYTFFDEPRGAKSVRAMMSGYASKLGYGGCEIFPKQNVLGKGQWGNWINLPYFNHDNGTRHAFMNGGPINITWFLKLVTDVKAMHHKKVQNVEALGEPDHGGMPPCLMNILAGPKIPEGSKSRNNCLYNFGVFYKRKYPDEWEDKISDTNYQIFEKPLSVREVQSITASISLKNYNYKCSEKPIESLCDKLACVTREFGVQGHTHSYENMTVGSLSKIMTDPPRWSLEINGVDLVMPTVDIMNYMRVRTLCMEQVDIIAPPMKQEDWLQIIKGKMVEKVVVDAPDDTGFMGRIAPVFSEFLSIAKNRNEVNFVDKGIPTNYEIEGKAVIIFRSSDFIAYAKRNRVDIVIGPELWIAFRDIGCDHRKVKINKKSVQVWYIPKTWLNTPDLVPLNEGPEI